MSLLQLTSVSFRLSYRVLLLGPWCADSLSEEQCDRSGVRELQLWCCVCRSSVRNCVVKSEWNFVYNLSVEYLWTLLWVFFLLFDGSSEY